MPSIREHGLTKQAKHDMTPQRDVIEPENTRLPEVSSATQIDVTQESQTQILRSLNQSRNQYEEILTEVPLGQAAHRQQEGLTRESLQRGFQHTQQRFRSLGEYLYRRDRRPGLLDRVHEHLREFRASPWADQIGFRVNQAIGDTMLTNGLLKCVNLSVPATTWSWETSYHSAIGQGQTVSGGGAPHVE
jgi:hypothetical protein